MLEKIVQVNRLGRWSYTARGSACDFDRFTILYGDNGSGKTMLAAALDSLRSNEPKFVLGRRSLGQQGLPEISILSVAGLHRFEGGVWNEGHDPLEVFYSGFIDRNVYTGQRVDVEHKRNLCEFVLGRESVTLKERIDQLDVEIRGLSEKIRSAENRIRPQILGAMPAQEFIALQPQSDVDEQIALRQKRLDVASHREELEGLPLPVAPELPPLPSITEIEQVLGASLENIAARSVAPVRQRVAQLGDNGEQWLRFGVQQCSDSECPFCGLDLQQSQLYDAYVQYFGRNYREFHATIAARIGHLKDSLDQAVFGRTVLAVQQALTAALAWAEVCRIDRTLLAADAQALAEEWEDCSSIVLAKLDAKLADPTESIVLDAGVRDAVRRMSDVRAKLSTLCTRITEVGAAARELKEQPALASTAEIGAELERLKNTRLRFTPPAAGDCSEWRGFMDAKAQAKRAKEEAKAKLEARMEDVVGRYENDINHFLSAFNAGFRIVEQRTTYSGGKAGVEYKLEISGETVPLGGDAESGEPCLANTLSEGDKSTLGLAFFLGRLRAKDVKDVSIVLDDPATSMDRERRNRTVQEIASLVKREAQVIVLTHDPALALSLWRHPLLKAAGCTSLSAVPLSAGTTLRAWDVEREATSGYFRNYFRLLDFAQNKLGDMEEIIRSTRPFVEDHLRHRFPGLFTHRESLGNMIGKIGEAEESNPLTAMKPKLDDLRDLNDSATDRAHGEELTSALPPTVTEAERLTVLAFRIAGMS